jgi:hypothetical protein
LAWSILVIDIIDWTDDTGAPMFKATANLNKDGGLPAAAASEEGL